MALFTQTASAAVPAVPAGLAVTSGDGTMKLDWDETTNAAGGYQYRYSDTQIDLLVGTGPAWVTATTDKGTTSKTIALNEPTEYTDSREVGTLYFFQVRGVASGTDEFSGGSDMASAVQRAAPPQLENFTATVGNGQVTLSWDAPPDIESIFNYDYRKAESGGSFSDDGWTSFTIETGGANSHVVTELNNGTTYSFQVRANNSIPGAADTTGTTNCNSLGICSGPASDTVTVTPQGPPAAPSELRADASGTEVRIYWRNPDNANIAHYQFRYKVPSATAWDPDWGIIEGSSASTTEHTITGLAAGTEYTFEVRAVGKGDVGAGETSSIDATPTTADSAPALMVGLTATVTGVTGGTGGDVEFSWQDPNDSTVTGYQFRWDPSSSNPLDGWDRDWPTGDDIHDVAGATATSSSFSIPGNSGPVFFQWRAINTTPDTDLFGVATAITVERKNTPGASPPPPDAPTDLIATVASGEVTLSWKDPSNSAITGYQFRHFRHSEDGRPIWDPDWPTEVISGSGATTKSLTISPLNNGTTYTFELRAVSANGNGAASRIDAATSGAPPKPTGLTPTNAPAAGQTYAVSGSQDVIEFDWIDPDSGDDVTLTHHWEYRYRVSPDTTWGVWGEVADYFVGTTIIWGVMGSETSANLGGLRLDDEGNIVRVPLVAGTLYEFQLRGVAVDDSTGEITGKSEPSDSAFAYTAFPAAPSAPESLRATGTIGAVILTWDVPKDASIHTYRYQATTAVDGEGNPVFTSATWVAFAYSTDETTDEPTVTGTFTNLAPDTYHFKIQAANTAGDSDDSNVASADSRAASGIWGYSVNIDPVVLGAGDANGADVELIVKFTVDADDVAAVDPDSVSVTATGGTVAASIEPSEPQVVGFGATHDAALATGGTSIDVAGALDCSYQEQDGAITCSISLTDAAIRLYANADAAGLYDVSATTSGLTFVASVNGFDATAGNSNDPSVLGIHGAQLTVGSIEPPTIAVGEGDPRRRDRRLLKDAEPTIIRDVDGVFRHEDGLDGLTITATSSDDEVVTVKVVEGSVNLELTPVGLGTATIRVTATTLAQISWYTVTEQEPTAWRIEPSITSVTLRGGEKVRLSVDVYGIQDILDADIVDDDEEVTVEWTDSPGGGSFAKQGGRTALYTAPSSPGSHTITATVTDGGCFPAEGEGDDIETDKEVAARCSASFEIVVRRASATGPADAAPVNPSGPIPSLLTDTSGTAHSVFTPEEGGDFAGDGFGISAGPGAVPNGEILGISMSAGDDAYNVGSTHQRYTLMGDSYDINLVNSSGAGISSYRLDSYAVACVPLPDSLRSDITNVALTAINEDGSLTILTSNVRLAGAGLEVCGRVSSLPATIAVGTSGAPPDFPPQPTEPEVESPDTGGTAPTPLSLFLMLMLGSALVLAPTALRRKWAARSIR